MRRGLLIWLSGIATTALIYAELDRRYDGWTFSENLRPWAKDHPVLFTGCCVAAPVSFWCHIIRKAVEGSLST